MHLKTLGKVETSFNTINNLIHTGVVGNQALAQSLIGLSTAEKLSVLSRTSLTESQKIGILATSGVNGMELKNIVTTNALSASQTTATKTTLGLATAMKGLKVSIMTSPLVLFAGMAAAAYSLVKVVDTLIVTVDEQIERNNALKDSYDSLIEEQNSVQSEINETKKRIEELQAIECPSIVEQGELERLKESNKELENRLILLKQESELKASELNRGIERAYDKDFNRKDVETNTPEWYRTGNQVWDKEKGAFVDEYALTGNNVMKSESEIFDENIARAKELIALGEKRTDAENEELNTLKEQVGEVGRRISSEISGYNAVTDAEKQWLSERKKQIDDAAYIVDPYAYAQNKFNTIWDSSDFSSTRKELEELSKAGELTPETLESTDDYKKLLEETGLTADKVAEHINSLNQAANKSGTSNNRFSKSEMISAINGMSEGFEALDKIMKAQSDKNPFDFSVLDEKSFNENFSALKDEYSNFVETISNSPKDVVACKDAYNELVTAWIDSKGILDQVNESNADVTESMLKNMGITNANVLVQNALAGARVQAVWESQNLANATSDEIIALVNEEEAANNTGEAFGAYLVQKMLAEAAIDTSGDISALANVVASLGLATSAWQRYYAAKQRMDQISADTNYAAFDENGSVVSKETVLAQYSKIAEDSLAEYAKELEDKAQKATYGGGNKTTGSGSGGSGSGGGSSDKSKTFDWIQRKIEILRDSYSKYNEELNDSNNSYRTQLNYLSEAERYLQEIVATEKKAEDVYFANWEQASAGLSDDIKSKIMKGNLSVEEYSSNSDAIDKAQSAWDSYANQMKARIQDEKELQNIQDSGHEKRVSHLQEQIETAKALGDASYISYGDSDASLATDLEEVKSQISEAKEELKDYKDSWKEARAEIKDAAKEAGVDYNELISGIEDGTLDPSDYEWDQNLRSVLVDGAEEYKQFSDLNERITELKTELTTEQKNLANAMDGTSLGYYETVIGLHQQIVDEVKTEVDTARTGWEQAKQALLDYGEANDEVNASSIIADVMNGKADLTQLKDDDPLKEIVESVIEAFGRYENSQKELVDAEMDLEEARREAYEKAIEYVEAQQNAISQINATIQSEMDLINASGGLIIEASYEEMIQNNDKLIESYEEQIKLIKDRLGEVEEESAEYYELKGDLEECAQEINNAKAEQAEWNRELKLLPIERIDQFLQMLDLIKTDLQDFMDWETTLGQANSVEEYQQLIDLESERIEKLKEQLATHEELLSEYEYGSDLYKETLTDINDVADAIAKAANEQQEYNKLLLQLPVEKITTLNEELQHYQSIVQAQLDEQETALSAITGLLQKETDALSKQQDEITEKYQEQIDPIEEQLEALEKQNDALKIQRDLEQSLYDLERANNQKTNKVRKLPTITVM